MPADLAQVHGVEVLPACRSQHTLLRGDNHLHRNMDHRGLRFGATHRCRTCTRARFRLRGNHGFLRRWQGDPHDPGGWLRVRQRRKAQEKSRTEGKYAQILVSFHNFTVLTCSDEYASAHRRLGSSGMAVHWAGRRSRSVPRSHGTAAPNQDVGRCRFASP